MEKNNKRKPQVSLPGGIASLVHRAQGLSSQGADVVEQGAAGKEQVSAAGASVSAVEQGVSGPVAQKAAGSAPKGTPMEHYAAGRAAGEDAWSLMMSTARAYKEYPGKLATVYIDSDLKRVLDRLRASSQGVSTSSLLSSIVASFVRDHDAEIRRECEF